MVFNDSLSMEAATDTFFLAVDSNKPLDLLLLGSLGDNDSVLDQAVDALVAVMRELALHLDRRVTGMVNGWGPTTVVGVT